MSAIRTSPMRSCARRSASIFPASPTATRRIFALGQGRTKNRVLPGLGRPGHRRADGAPQCRDPRQRDSRAHGREHNHPDRISGLGGGGAKGARHRFRVHQRFATLNLRNRPSDLHFERLQRRRRRGGESPGSPQGKVVNALTIRGADQVSLRVTVAEIRRDIVKQLGVNLSGSGPNGSFTLDPPFAINGTSPAPSPPPLPRRP